MKIEIDINGVHRDEIEELKKYLEENCWKWQASSTKLQASGSRRDPDFLKQKKI
jgi:hypothetical protein